MKLEQALRAQVELRFVGQAELRPREWTRVVIRTPVIARQPVEQNQPLRVVRLRIGWLDAFGGKEIIEVGNSGSDRMPPAHALHRRKAREGKKIGQRRHP